MGLGFSSILYSRLWLLLFCICNFFIHSSELKAQKGLSGLPLTRNFTTDDYGGGIQNWDLYQDSYGLLYVANNFGLLVFDGEYWEQVSLDYNTRTLTVYVDDEQRIYVGGQGNFGYLEPKATEGLSYVSLKEMLPEPYRNFDEVWNIHAVGEEIIFCTLENIFAYDGTNLRIVDPQVDLGLSFLVNDKLYVAAKERGILRLEIDGLDLIPGSERLADMDIRGIVPYDDEHLLIATREEGFYLLSSYSVKLWESKLSALENLQVNTMEILRNGQIAVGTQNLGLLLLNREGNVIYQLGKRRGLTSSTVLTLLEDRLGNLWAGLNNGISYVEIDRPFTHINDNMGLPGTGYAAALHDEKLYLGTSRGLFVKEWEQTNQSLQSDFELVKGTSGQVYDLKVVDGQLLMAHHQGGFLINDHQARQITGFRGAWKFEPIPGTNKMLAGTYDGVVLLQKQEGQWRFIKKFADFGESSRKFELDDRGRVWISHGYKGVYQLTFSDNYDSLQKTRFYGAEDGFPSNLLINVFRIGGNLVYTAEQGIYRYNSGKDLFQRDENLSSFFGNEHVRELEEDIFGNIYFITDQEIGRLRKISQNSYDKETSAFKEIYNLISDDLENITSINQHISLIDAKEGFIQVDLRKRKSPPDDFRALIRTIQWNDSTFFNGFYNQQNIDDMSTIFGEGGPVLPFGKNSLQFQFSSTFYEGMQHTLYRYRLNGYQEQWSEWSDQTLKEYTNLPVGNYSFSVQAKNIYGKESSEMHFGFIIAPPWYRSQLAYSMFILSFLMLMGSTITVMDFRHRKTRRAIEDNARNTIGKKEAALKAVTQKSEEEITKLNNERLALEIQHKNSQLASSAMHLINKNEFIQTIKSNLKDLTKDIEGRPEAVKSLKRVVKDIDRNTAGDDDWDRFEMHFDQVHGDFLKKMKDKFPELTPQELKLSAFLKMGMSSKEIAYLFNISVRGVEISRYRLRKKLPLERNDNLIEYMMKL